MFQRLHLKITDNQTFPLQVKAQLRELVFMLNKQTGLTLKMNIQGIGRKWWGPAEEPSHVTDGRLELGSEATPGRRQALLWLQLGGYPGQPTFKYHASECLSGGLYGITVLPNGYEAATSHSRTTTMKTMGLSLDPPRPIGLDPHRPRSKPPCSLPSLSVHPYSILEPWDHKNK